MEYSSVGPYRIVERLGAGGMGEVHLAVDTRLNRKVALKSLTDPSLDTPNARSRLLREARAAAQITHPNIAAIYDILETGAHPCIVMEYAQGETLARIASRGPMPCHQVLAIASQLAGALAHAHAAGVVHRDLKPSNIVLTPDGVVKVLDFGLARVHDIEQELASAGDPTREATVSRAGVMAGTPAYMAPEQLVGHPASPLSDIYSLGATLFELLAGRKPFEAPTTRDVIYQILAKPTPLVSAVNGSVPPIVDAIVAKAMAKEPSERYLSAAQMAEDLGRAALECAAEPGRPGSRGSTVGLAASFARMTSRRRWIAGLVGAAIVAAVLIPTGYLLRGRWAAAPPIASQFVAVLPFVNDTGDSASDVSAAAFTASIVDALEGLSNVTVVSRRDTAEHFPSPAGLEKGARELGVSMIVSGSLSRVAGGHRFLVKVARADGRVVSTRQYPANPGGVASRQAQAVNDVVSVLGVTLTPEDTERLATRVLACRAEAYPDYVAGRALLEREDIVGNPQKAEEAFLRAVTLDPNCAVGFAGLADARWARYRDTKDPSLAEMASRAIESALTLDDRNPSIQMSVAKVYLGRGKADQAEQIVRRVIAARPTDDAPRRVLGDVLDYLGRTEEAIGAYIKAIELRPTNVLNHLSLGLRYYNRGRNPEAISAYEKALEIQPDNMWAILDLGAAYYALGELDRALAVYKKAPKPDPTILSNSGSIYYAKGMFDEAARAFEQAVAQDPRGDIKHRNLGDVYLRLKQRDKAMEQYRIAADLTEQMRRVNAQDAQVLARHALYDAKLGRAADALQHVEQAVKLSPDDNSVLYKRAVVHCLLNQPVEAIEWLRRAIQKGYSQSTARSDDDLDPIKKRPEVVEMLRGDR